MNYGLFELDLVKQLAPLNEAGVEVQALPETEAQKKGLLAAARVTVAYKESKWPTLQSTDHVSQHENVFFEISVQGRKLRGDGGVYAVTEIAKKLLVGYRPLGFQRLKAVEYGFTNYTEGAWTHTFILKTEILLVQDELADPEEVGPLLAQLDFDDSFGGGSIGVDDPEYCDFVKAELTDAQRRCLSVRVVSGAGFFDETFEPGTSAPLPNVTHIDSDGSSVEWEAMKPFECSTVAGGTVDVTANGAAFATANAGETVNVPVRDTAAAPVGSIVGGAVVVGDSSVGVTDSAGAVLHTKTVKAEGTETQAVGDSTVNVRRSDATLIESKAVKAEGVESVTVADSTVSVRDSAGVELHLKAVKADSTDSQTVGDSTVNVRKSDGVLIEAKAVKAEGTEDAMVADSVVTVKDSAGATLETKNVKATDAAEVIAPDGTAVLKDSAAATLRSVAIKAGEVKDVPIGDATVNIRRSDATLIEAKSVTAEGTDSATVSDSTVNIRKSDGVLIEAKSVKADASDDATVSDSVIRLEDSAGGLLETRNVKATDPEIIVAPNGTLNVNKSDGALISARTVKSGGVEGFNVADSVVTNDATTPTYTQAVKATENLILPPQQININGVDRGDIASVGTIDFNITDGVNPVVPNNVGVSGRTVTITLPKEVFIKGIFGSANDTMETLVIDAYNAGTYTSITDDGASGAITLSKNGGAFAAFSSPLVLVATDTLVVKRATTGSVGFYKLEGTYA